MFNFSPPAIAIAPTLLAGAGSALMIALMLRHRHALPMDEPNHRSLHQAPVPRSGGIGIMAGSALGWLFLGLTQGFGGLGNTLIGGLGLSAFSLLDDVRGLPAGWRFAVQIAVAALVIASGAPALGLAGMIAAVLAVTWMTNLFNFMDGANGLAGGMALFGFGFYAWAAFLAGDTSLALASACLSAAAAGFLLFNFDPARIFMGDTGSIALGFLAGALGLAGWQRGAWPLLFPLLVFSPFIVDASLTLARRLSNGEKVWQAHRSHYYQRLIRMGLGHRRTALAEYAIMLACGLSAVLLQGLPLMPQLALGVTWLLTYAIIAARIDALWKRSSVAS